MIGRPVARTLMVRRQLFSDDMRLLMSEDITQGQNVSRRCGAISSPTCPTRCAPR